MASDLEDRLGRALRAGDAADRKRPVVPPPITDVVAPLGPNARAMLCGACNRCGEFAELRKYMDGELGANWRLCARCHGFASTYTQPSPRPTVLRLLADTKAVILRRRQECYGGLAISDEQADELARALVQNLLGNYEITGVAP